MQFSYTYIHCTVYTYLATFTRIHRSHILCFALHLTAAFNVSLELRGLSSDQLTLICRHSEAGTAPQWIHNGTLESGQLLGTAFPGAVYTVLARTEHTTTITGVDSVRELDGYFFQCAYEDLGSLVKSNAVAVSFVPPGQSQNTFSVGCALTGFSHLCK